MTTLGSLGRKLAVNSTFGWTGRWIALSSRLVIRRGGAFAMGRNARVGENVRIIVDSESSLAIGAQTTIERGGEMTAVNGARVIIGVGTYVGNYCNIRSDKDIRIGDDCYLAQFVSVLDGGYRLRGNSDRITREDYETKSVSIGHNVWLGVGVIVLPGVVIGDGAVVGAGAVVTKDVAPRAIAVGNPAHVIATRPGRSGGAPGSGRNDTEPASL